MSNGAENEEVLYVGTVSVVVNNWWTLLAPGRTVEIDKDFAVEIEAVALPPEDPDALWGM